MHALMSVIVLHVVLIDTSRAAFYSLRSATNLYLGCQGLMSQAYQKIYLSSREILSEMNSVDLSTVDLVV